MRPSEIGRALAAIIPTRQPTLILGPPGVGKDSVAFQAAAAIYDGETEESREANSVRTTVGGLPDTPWIVYEACVDKDPTDVVGLPFVRDGWTNVSKPDLYRRVMGMGERGGVVVLSDFCQAIPAVQCAYRGLLLDRRIGGHRIPDNVTVVATGNRPQDRAGANKLLTHVASSVVLLELEVSNDDWQSLALRKGIPHEVRSFLNFKPGAIHDFEPSRLVNTDPRGWERVGILSRSVPDDLLLNVISGCVCPGHAAEFMAHRQMANELPDPREILANPDKIKMPQDASILYALSGALVEVVREKKTSEKTGNNLIRFCERMANEAPRGSVYGVLTVKDAIAVAQQMMVPVATKSGWIKKYKDLIYATTSSKE